MMSELRKYGVLLTTAKAIQFTLYQVDGVDIEPAATFAAGDIKISKNGGAEVDTANLPTDEGNGYRLILTAAELTASRIRLFIVDQTATKVWLDIEINIETFGHASAMFVTDFDEVMRGTDNAALASVATEARLAELDAANIPANIDTLLGRIIGTLATGTHNPATATQIAVLSDWINGGRLDLILDLILADSAELQTNQGNWLTATGFSTHSVADIFNEVLSKAVYNVGQSLAKIVRELGSWNSAEGAVTGTPTTTVIATNITGYDTDFFRDQGFWAYNGATQAGQSRIVTAYNTDGTFTFDEPFTTALIAGDDVVIATPHVHSMTELAEGVRTEMDSNSTKLTSIDARLPAALVGGKMNSDAVAVGGSTDGATRLGKATQANVYGTIGSGSTTTSLVTSALDPSAAATDQFKGKIVTFDANTTTANLRGQSTDITANTAGGVLTVTALTTAAVSGDIFVIT